MRSLNNVNLFQLLTVRNFPDGFFSKQSDFFAGRLNVFGGKFVISQYGAKKSAVFYCYFIRAHIFAHNTQRATAGAR